MKKSKDSDKLAHLIKGIKSIVAYPKKGQGRRTKKGFPSEIEYDQFAYERMIASYRDGLKNLLKEIKSS